MPLKRCIIFHIVMETSFIFLPDMKMKTPGLSVWAWMCVFAPTFMSHTLAQIDSPAANKLHTNWKPMRRHLFHFRVNSRYLICQEISSVLVQFCLRVPSEGSLTLLLPDKSVKERRKRLMCLKMKTDNMANY